MLTMFKREKFFAIVIHKQFQNVIMLVVFGFSYRLEIDNCAI